MLNEFRQDLVSGDWVLFATGRAKGHINKKEKFYQPKEGCPFENLQASGNENPVLVFSNGVVVPNKFPAVKPGICGPLSITGPFNKIDALGYHELVITNDHDKGLHQFSQEETSGLLTAYRDRYREISKYDCGEYILIFHNQGPAAGATIFHNHSQILSTPIIPPEIQRSIRGAEDFYKKEGKKVFDVSLGWEKEQAKRIFFENDKFFALCPFVSRTPYEIRIFPKVAAARFEKIDDIDIPFLADALNSSLKKIDKALDSPDYNFYIHTAPVKNNSEEDYYHWHIEVVPRLSMMGGLELGTNVYLNVVDPDEAADLLRNTNV